MKKYILLLFPLLFLLGCASFELVEKPTQSENKISEQWKEALIIDILSKTRELNIHRMNGQEDNQVFVHENGAEIVFDRNNERVTDPVNMGSYNYYSATERPLAHFSQDTHPWLLLGNSPEDSSTLAQRLEAYLKDFKIGVIEAFNESPVQVGITTVSYLSEAERNSAVFFVNAFDDARNDSFFDIYENSTITNEKIDVLIDELYVTLKRTLPLTLVGGL